MRNPGPAVCVIASAGAAFGTVILLGRMWSACDVGGAGNAMVLLLLYLPATFVVSVAVTGVVYAVTQRVSHRTSLACLAAVVAAVLIVWATLWLFHGGDYPTPICEDNIPPWWPDWIPL
ncbi:hypothetical protein [Nocardia sp. XZ_19_369]|uniref:hypothetical protein n=1 Tax=Nocardia sp. XZ_19_369 TaxID=2769487 RepID=UPI00188F47B1|nr:hypothetical protein [Nocardia sp. XZ_19_369]